MNLLNYDLVELRFNEVANLKIIDVIYDEYENDDCLYFHNTFIVDFEHRKLIINSNILYIEDEILFRTDSNDFKINQFVGIAKVIFDNMIEPIAMENNIESAEVNILGLDELISERLAVINEINEVGEDNAEEQLFEKYEAIMIEMEMAFVSSLLPEELIEENIKN